MIEVMLLAAWISSEVEDHKARWKLLRVDVFYLIV